MSECNYVGVRGEMNNRNKGYAVRQIEIVVVAICLGIVGRSAFSAEEQPQYLMKVKAAIEIRRAIAHAITVAGVTTSIRTVDRETSADLPEPVSSQSSFKWTVAPKASRFRLEETSPRVDPTNQSSFEMETVMAFDGTNGVLWHPQRKTMSDGTPHVDASKVSAENGFLKGRIFGPVFWWLGILDDYEALISGKSSDLDTYEWSQSPDGEEMIATIKNGEREREFIFSSKYDYNVIRATRRLYRSGEVLVTSNTTVTYEQRNGLMIPVLDVREISSGVDSTDFTSWDLIPELPIEQTRLPPDFLEPGMLVSDDSAEHILDVSEQKTLVPRLPGSPLPAANSSRRIVFFGVAALAAVAIYIVRIKRSRA